MHPIFTSLVKNIIVVNSVLCFLLILAILYFIYFIYNKFNEPLYKTMRQMNVVTENMKKIQEFILKHVVDNVKKILPKKKEKKD